MDIVWLITFVALAAAAGVLALAARYDRGTAPRSHLRDPRFRAPSSTHTSVQECPMAS